MSTEFETPLVEQRSSVRIATTASGKPTVEVKVYEKTTAASLEDARQLALDAFQKTVAAVVLGSGT